MKLRILIYLLTILPLLTYGQSDEKKLLESFSYSDGHFYHRLDLFKDSTFAYKYSCRPGSISSSGSWKMINDILTLTIDKTPWSIIKVDEQKLDTIIDKVIVKVLISGGSLNVAGFNVWVNNDCENNVKTDSLGIAEFKTEFINKISMVCNNEYELKDSLSNYIVVTLPGIYSIYSFVSPRQSVWSEWKVTGDEISPIVCGQVLYDITLRKK